MGATVMSSTDIPVDGYELARDISGYLRERVLLPYEEAYLLCALWILHVHALRCFDSTPRLGFFSSRSASGKTTAVRAVSSLLPNPRSMSAVTQSNMTRIISNDSGDGRPLPTIMLDSFHSVQGGRETPEKLKTYEVIETGFERNGVVHRQRQPQQGEWEMVEYSTFSSMIIAGLIRPFRDDTLPSRMIRFQMQPTTAAQRNQLRTGNAFSSVSKVNSIKTRATAWAKENADAMRSFVAPKDLLYNREDELWTPLLAVADSCEINPEANLKAYLSVPYAPRLDQQYLIAIHNVWPEGETHVRSSAMLDLLERIPDSYWRSDGGKRVTPTYLTQYLSKNFGIPVEKNGHGYVLGYPRWAFLEHWENLPEDLKSLLRSAGLQSTSDT
jgi:hypothetical protein